MKAVAGLPHPVGEWHLQMCVAVVLTRLPQLRGCDVELVVSAVAALAVVSFVAVMFVMAVVLAMVLANAVAAVVAGLAGDVCG